MVDRFLWPHERDIKRYTSVDSLGIIDFDQVDDSLSLTATDSPSALPDRLSPISSPPSTSSLRAGVQNSPARLGLLPRRTAPSISALNPSRRGNHLHATTPLRPLPDYINAYSTISPSSFSDDCEDRFAACSNDDADSSGALDLSPPLNAPCHPLHPAPSTFSSSSSKQLASILETPPAPASPTNNGPATTTTTTTSNIDDIGRMDLGNSSDINASCNSASPASPLNNPSNTDSLSNVETAGHDAFSKLLSHFPEPPLGNPFVPPTDSHCRRRCDNGDDSSNKDDNDCDFSKISSDGLISSEESATISRLIGDMRSFSRSNAFATPHKPSSGLPAQIDRNGSSSSSSPPSDQPPYYCTMRRNSSRALRRHTLSNASSSRSPVSLNSNSATSTLGLSTGRGRQRGGSLVDKARSVLATPRAVRPDPLLDGSRRLSITEADEELFRVPPPDSPLFHREGEDEGECFDTSLPISIVLNQLGRLENQVSVHSNGNATWSERRVQSFIQSHLSTLSSSHLRGDPPAEISRRQSAVEPVSDPQNLFDTPQSIIRKDSLPWLSSKPSAGSLWLEDELPPDSPFFRTKTGSTRPSVENLIFKPSSRAKALRIGLKEPSPNDLSLKPSSLSPTTPTNTVDIMAENSSMGNYDESEPTCNLASKPSKEGAGVAAEDATEGSKQQQQQSSPLSSIDSDSGEAKRKPPSELYFFRIDIYSLLSTLSTQVDCADKLPHIKIKRIVFTESQRQPQVQLLTTLDDPQLQVALKTFPQISRFLRTNFGGLGDSSNLKTTWRAQASTLPSKLRSPTQRQSPFRMVDLRCPWLSCMICSWQFPTDTGIRSVDVIRMIESFDTQIKLSELEGLSGQGDSVEKTSQAVENSYPAGETDKLKIATPPASATPTPMQMVKKRLPELGSEFFLPKLQRSLSDQSVFDSDCSNSTFGSGTARRCAGKLGLPQPSKISGSNSNTWGRRELAPRSSVSSGRPLSTLICVQEPLAASGHPSPDMGAAMLPTLGRPQNNSRHVAAYSAGSSPMLPVLLEDDRRSSRGSTTTTTPMPDSDLTPASQTGGLRIRQRPALLKAWSYTPGSPSMSNSEAISAEAEPVLSVNPHQPDSSAASISSIPTQRQLRRPPLGGPNHQDSTPVGMSAKRNSLRHITSMSSLLLTPASLNTSLISANTKAAGSSHNASGGQHQLRRNSEQIRAPVSAPLSHGPSYQQTPLPNRAQLTATPTSFIPLPSSGVSGGGSVRSGIPKRSSPTLLTPTAPMSRLNNTSGENGTTLPTRAQLAGVGGGTSRYSLMRVGKRHSENNATASLSARNSIANLGFRRRPNSDQPVKTGGRLASPVFSYETSSASSPTVEYCNSAKSSEFNSTTTLGNSGDTNSGSYTSISFAEGGGTLALQTRAQLVSRGWDGSVGGSIRDSVSSTLSLESSDGGVATTNVTTNSSVKDQRHATGPAAVAGLAIRYGRKSFPLVSPGPLTASNTAEETQRPSRLLRPTKSTMQFRTKIANTLRRSFRGSSGARAGAAAAPAKATRRPAVVSPTNSHIEGVSRPTDDDATLLRHSPPTTTVTTTMTHTHHSSKFRARLLTAAGKSPTVSVPPLSSSHNYQSAKPSTAGCAIQYSGIKSPTALPKLSKFKSDLSLKSALATAAKQLDVVPGSTDAVTLRWEGSKDRILRKVESVAGLSMIPLLGEGTTYDSQSGGSFRTQMHRRALTSTAVPEDNRTNSLQLDIDPTIIDETMYANDDNNDNGGGSNPARQGHQEKEEEWLMLRPVETPDMVPRLFSPQDLDRAMTPLIKTIYTNGAAGAAPSISAVLAPNFQSPTTKPRQIAPVDLENYEFSSDNLPATIASESNDRMPSDSPSQSPGKLTGSVPLAPPSSHIGHWNDSGNTASVESMVLSNPSATLHNGLDGTANQLAQPPEKTNSAGMPKKCRPSLFQLGFDEGNELSTNPSSDVLRQQETPQEVQSGVNSRQSSPALSALIMDYEDDEMFENPLAASQPILHRESVAATDGSERILEGDNEGGGWQRYRDGAKLSYHESFYALPKGGPEDSEDDFLPKSIGGVSGHASYLSPPSSPDERAGSGISSMLKLRRSRSAIAMPNRQHRRATISAYKSTPNALGGGGTWKSRAMALITGYSGNNAPEVGGNPASAKKRHSKKIDKHEIRMFISQQQQQQQQPGFLAKPVPSLPLPSIEDGADSVHRLSRHYRRRSSLSAAWIKRSISSMRLKSSQQATKALISPDASSTTSSSVSSNGSSKELFISDQPLQDPPLVNPPSTVACQQHQQQ